jgi:hypothetical protein
VADFVRQIGSVDPRAPVVVAGDMNDDEASPTLAVLGEAGLVSTWDRVLESDRYTYVFQGSSEVVDHVLLSAALGDAVTDVRVIHANADFASAASDHDPVVVRMSIRGEGKLGAGCRCSLGTGRRIEGAAWIAAFAALLARRGQKHAGRDGRRCGGIRRFLSGLGFSGKDRRP